MNVALHKFFRRSYILYLELEKNDHHDYVAGIIASSNIYDYTR